MSLFIQARNCGPVRPADPVNLIVIHTMEAPEKPNTAKNVAMWFASAQAPQASAHYCIDAEEIVQCVLETVVAWAAPGANKEGIHLEHAGYAKQSASDWSDAYSTRMLERSAALAADIARRHQVPLVRLTAADLRTPGVRGFTGHVDVTNGRNGGKGHTDPGVDFPWDRYLELISNFLRPTDPPPPPSDEIA